MKNIFAIILTFAIVVMFTSQGMAQTAMAGASVDNVSAGSNLNQGAVASYNTNVAAPIPGMVGYGPVLNYFGKPLPSEGFQPLETILMYVCWFSDGALESMLKGFDDAEAELEIADLTYNDAPIREENGDTKYIKIVVSRDKYASANMDFIGYVTAKADGKNATMVEVMAAAALEAMEAGANVIHFTAQGAVRDVFSSGWGIGTVTTQAQINGADHTNVTSGGMGYSSAQAGTRDLPWLQGFAIVDYDLMPPVKKPMTR